MRGCGKCIGIYIELNYRQQALLWLKTLRFLRVRESVDFCDF
jgi:hypothetical protein